MQTADCEIGRSFVSLFVYPSRFLCDFRISPFRERSDATMSQRWIGATWRTVAGCACGILIKNSIVLPASRSFTVSAYSLFFSKDTLGLRSYESVRKRTTTQLDVFQGRFRLRMEECLSGASLLFTEDDLINMCYLAKDDKDLQLLNRMLKRYVQHSSETRFGGFRFGPILMRLHHHLNKPDEALASIQDPDLAQVYDQLTSYWVAMDLLYENQRYDDVLELYSAMSQRPFIADRSGTLHLTLAYAACCKLGTFKAYTTARGLVKNAMPMQLPVKRKVVTVAAALAVKHNDPIDALEMLSCLPPANQYHITVRNLRILALTRLHRWEHVLSLLRWNTAQDIGAKGLRFFPDVIAEVKKAVETKEDKELRQAFDKAFEALERGHAITADTLKERLKGLNFDDHMGPACDDQYNSRVEPEDGPMPLQQQCHRDEVEKSNGNTMLRRVFDKLFNEPEQSDVFDAKALNDCWDRLIADSSTTPDFPGQGVRDRQVAGTFQQQRHRDDEGPTVGGGRHYPSSGRVGGSAGSRTAGGDDGVQLVKRDRVLLPEQGMQRARGGPDSGKDKVRKKHGERATETSNPNWDAGYRPRG
ncbi:pentatricopeptide repeat-containing protein 2, mitochondrial-like [Paramacrobiotus metropolitanus]|uniref:pentatricopeptide repeat-containing protein 2, mitochondrial-like n=1 Tax=Paramacrobiotus metropolitanus TaxID=2943436 RepID=UPI002445AFB8|nr:pentatricopeptide repeat-containing protein 2, mitochondrial-like [Paramacrobiotus metropolitanus]